MEIVWQNNKVKKQVVKIARSNQIVNRRMSELKNTPCYSDLPANCKAHFLHGDLANLFAIDFDYPARLICRPVGEFQTKDNQFVEQSIATIEIVKIEKDYH